MPFSSVTRKGGLRMAPEQTADFTAAVGYEYPVDMRAFPIVGWLVVTPPPTPKANDSFAIFDSRLACTLQRTIIADFAGGVIHSLPNDQGIINDLGDRIEFTYVDAVIGWRVAANTN